MKTESNSNRDRQAFTLIELLVVISIIALLLAILMPSLSKVKEMAKTLHCQTNLKTMMTAVTTYAVDNDDKFPGSYTYSGSGGWGNPWDWAWAPWKINSNHSVSNATKATLDERHEGIKRGTLYPYVESVGSYHCVSDDSFGKNFRSYSMPDSINGLWGKPTGNAVWTTLTKTTQVKRSATMYIFLEENDPRGYNINSWVINGTMGKNSNSWADPLTVWHGGKSNFGYLDGHADTRKWSKETEELFTKTEQGSWNAWGRVPDSESEEEKDLKWLLDGWPE